MSLVAGAAAYYKEYAAKALLADGDPVTSRAIRDRVKVRMSVAAQVAREVNEVQQLGIPATEVHNQVATLWRLAVQAAKQKHETELTVMTEHFGAVRAERDELVALVTDMEEQLVQARGGVAKAADANARALAAEARADGLREALVALAPHAEKKN